MTTVERSAVVALHRLSHPEERNGRIVGEDNPVSELMRQAVVFIERWNAELNERDAYAAPSQSESVAPAATEHATPAPQSDDFNTLANRKPILQYRAPEVYRLRKAARRSCGVLYQEPPRTTRRPQSPVVLASPLPGLPWLASTTCRVRCRKPIS
jgi:hypothetical protein